MSAKSLAGSSWRRIYAMLIKEFIRLTRDCASFAMIVLMPLLQLLLFDCAINTTPRDLPTAVLLQESSYIGPAYSQGDGEHPLFQGHTRPARSADGDRLAAGGRIVALLDRCVERIHVDVDDLALAEPGAPLTSS
ncbi:hypothetical protein SAMN05443254_1122 [Bradyrhizobium sp. OK095]|nr:hypothetical protein SAMN05443254_1122 [Bradyrhizobium sp. OK095]